MNDKYLMDSNKLLYHMPRVIDHYDKGKRISPLHVDIGATKICNAKCVYCYGTYQKMSNDIIPRDALLNLFKDAPELGIKSLTLTGDGEPTLNPAVYDAIKIGHNKGLDIGLATNGIALDEPKLRTLLSTCTWLRFNLSAASHSSYESIHGVDCWDKVRANIILASELKAMYGYECTIGLQMVLIPEALGQVIPEAKFAVDYNLDYFVIKQFSDPGCKEMSQFSLRWYDSPSTLDILRQAEVMSNETTKIIPKWDRIASKGKRPYDKCVDCALIFQISGNSKCYPCGFLFNKPEFEYGDLKKQRLGEILKSEQYWKVINFMKNEFDVHSMCKGECRHSSTNEFVWNYLHKPSHISFI